MSVISSDLTSLSLGGFWSLGSSTTSDVVLTEDASPVGKAAPAEAGS